MSTDDPLAEFVHRAQAAQAAVDALARDARDAYELFATMRTAELRELLIDGARPLALLTEMVTELETREEPITLVLRPLSALYLAGLLQLALRHPGTNASAAHASVAVTFLEHVRAYFADAPAVLEVLRRGDDPAEDAGSMRETGETEDPEE